MWLPKSQRHDHTAKIHEGGEGREGSKERGAREGVNRRGDRTGEVRAEG
jgi:hypothetical protein